MEFAYRFPVVRGIQANSEYFIAMAMAFSIVPIVELVKLCERVYHNRKK